MDATGKVIGQHAGFLNGSYEGVYTPEGAILGYDTNISTGYPSVTNGSTLFYKAAACAGQAYAQPNSSYPFQTAFVLEGPPSPGSKIYVALPGTPESFSALSYKNSTGCNAGPQGVSGAYTVKQAGVVPSITKPLSVVPAG